MIPSPWEFALLALATVSVWKLIAEDKITERPRDWLLVRMEIDELIECPWCSGFWIAVAWTGAWLAGGDWTLLAAAPFALRYVVGFLTSIQHAISD